MSMCPDEDHATGGLPEILMRNCWPRVGLDGRYMIECDQAFHFKPVPDRVSKSIQIDLGFTGTGAVPAAGTEAHDRSEERRVGRECRAYGFSHVLEVRRV